MAVKDTGKPPESPIEETVADLVKRVAKLERDAKKTRDASAMIRGE